MPYSIFDLEATGPLPAVATRPEDTGAAFLVRRAGRPVAFWMEELPGGTSLAPDAVTKRIEREAGIELLQDRLYDEMAPPDAPLRPLPALTVAVCTHDRPERLARCLDALDQLDAPPGDLEAPLEVLVVDNAPSEDRTRRLVEHRENVRYAREPRAGLDFARNRAIEEATGTLLAFLDDDVVVDPGWLTGLAEAWNEHPDAAAFTGLILPYALETEAQILFEQRGGFRRGFEKIRYGEELPGNPLYPCGAGIFGAGANMAFRRDALRALGGFDEALDTGAPLPGGGDLDMFYRVIRAGEVLAYEPRLLAFHEHRRTIEALRRQYWSWGLGHMAFIAKAYRHDPANRALLRGLVRWWARYEGRQLRESFGPGHALTPRMALSEIAGSVQGLLGEYARSRRRVAHIRRRAAPQAA